MKYMILIPLLLGCSSTVTSRAVHDDAGGAAGQAQGSGGSGGSIAGSGGTAGAAGVAGSGGAAGAAGAAGSPASDAGADAADAEACPQVPFGSCDPAACSALCACLDARYPDVYAGTGECIIFVELVCSCAPEGDGG